MRRGDVVTISWPNRDLTGWKERVAVVVQTDELRYRLNDDTVLVKITSWRFGTSGTKVSINPAVETASGLSKLCFAYCQDILKGEETHVLRKIGVLSDEAMRQIEACLKVVLGISTNRRARRGDM